MISFTSDIDSEEALKVNLDLLADLWRKGEKFQLSVEPLTEQRTDQQRKAIEVYCRELAKALNAAGYDQRAVMSEMKEGVEVPWRQESVKETLLKPIVKAVLKKDSTTKLDTAEVSKVYDILNRWTSEKFGVSVLFPDRFSQMEEAA